MLVKINYKTCFAYTLIIIACWSLFRLAFYYNFYFGSGWQSDDSTSQNRGTVLLVHGIRASAGCMDNIAKFLDKEGYYVVNLDYPSSEYDIATLSKNYLKSALLKLQDEPLHIVTHSMGGLVLRQYLRENEIPNLKNIVMIAPPNHGSEWSDFFGSWKIAKLIMGPALTEMRTNSDLLAQLPEPNVPTAIIAGESKWSLIGNLLTDGPTDGKVTVTSTKLPSMKAFTIVEKNHNDLLSSEETMRQIASFLKTNQFHS